MKLIIDLEAGTVSQLGGESEQTMPIGSPEAFALVSRAWLRAGWDAKYVYSFSWLGRPIIQLPEDLLRIQEVIYRVQPDVIIETGIAHGGSLVFYASLCKAMGHGRVVGVDIDIRAHNRSAIVDHALSGYLTLIEGNSVDPQVVKQVHDLVKPGETALVLLDSGHTKAHVAAELAAYCDLVTVGSYIMAADGIMADVVGAPRTLPDWTWNNPQAAVRDFAAEHPEFVIEDPAIPFNEGYFTGRVSYWQNGFLRRRD